MNVDDVIGAMEDLVEAHGAVPTDKVHVRSINGGSESIDGFDVVDGSVYVLGADGKPAVSAKVVRKLEAEYKGAIRNLDALAESVRYQLRRHQDAESVADEIIEIISDLERKVGDIV